LRLRADPNASAVRARTIGTSINVGVLGIGPLIADCLAQWAPLPLTLPYLLFVALGAVALIGAAAAPETGTPTPRPITGNHPAGSRRRVRLPAPAAAATLALSPQTAYSQGCPGSFSLPRFTVPHTDWLAPHSSWRSPAE
jgi:hypothetical protein